MLILFRTFFNIFKVEDLRNKILYTLGVVAIYRLGNYILLPDINGKALLSLSNSFNTGGLLSYMDLLAGGALRRGSIFALGISPYINASILISFLKISVPSLEALSNEGESGRRIINQYTRYLTVFMSVIYGAVAIGFFEFGSMRGGESLFVVPGLFARLKSIFILTVGAIFSMWLGEQISKYGVGSSGSSILIFSGIAASLPGSLAKLIDGFLRGNFTIIVFALTIVMIAALIAFIVFVERAQRRVPIHYAKRVVGKKLMGGVTSYIPFRINAAGVMPTIMATSFMTMIATILAGISWYLPVFANLKNSVFYAGDSVVYYVIFALATVFFSYIYTTAMYNPIDLAEYLRKSGAFIPGVRPGNKTAETFNYILTRVCLPGALYLVFVTLVPTIIGSWMGVPVLLAGASIYIAVGVAMDTFAQIESVLIERRYEGFLQSGRLKGRRA